MFSLFYNVWSNPKTKIYSLIKYLLENLAENSHTWCIHLRNVSKMYGMVDPLYLLNSNPPSKESYKESVKIVITSYHEKHLRNQMKNSESTKFFNISLLGLSGKTFHPIIDFVKPPRDVKNMRPHLKFLAGDYLSREKLSRQGNCSPKCLICDSQQEENYIHIIIKCQALEVPRKFMLTKLVEFCEENNF